MIYRLHSTPEIDVCVLIDCLMKMYVLDAARALDVFQRAFKNLPEHVIVDVLEMKIPYMVNENIIIIDTKKRG